MEPNGRLQLDVSQGVSVETRQLNFAFSKHQPVLRDFNMQVPAGKMVCVAGPEGAGKSTLLRLLTGSYSDFDGQVLINGIPIGNYDLDSLRNATGIYFSQQEIFEGTLWENISLGDCHYSPQELKQMADRIGLGNFVAELKHGFDTELDPMGRRLSKTTTQRILFLRAIAGKPKLLLLEEPWEGMDEVSKAQMITFLRNDLRDCTIVVAANDPDFLQVADIVYRMNSDR